MKRFFSFSAGLIIISMLLVSCNNWFNPPIVIPGTPGPNVLPLTGFDEIVLRAPIHLHLTDAPTHRVEVVADSFWQSRIEVNVAGNTLEVTLLPDTTNTQPDTIPMYDIQLFVDLPALTRVETYSAAKIETTNRFTLGDLALELNGAADVSFEADANEIDLQISGATKAELDIALDTLHTEINGAGRLIATGTAAQHNIDVAGAGDINGFDLVADACDVDIQGAGSFEVTAQTTLNVDIAGIAVVYYKGNPTITQNITGLGRVVDAN